MRTGTYSILKKITKVGKTKEIVSLKNKITSLLLKKWSTKDHLHINSQKKSHLN
jgi:hypothetical protein